MTPGQAAFRLAFEISPIYLTGGLVGGVPGATVPIISFTEGGGFGNILGAGSGVDLDKFFAHFRPLPGSRLVNNAIGTYPFANQSVAANALITSPLTISMLMVCPSRNPGDYSRRQAVITSLIRTLEAHNLAGGTYSVATPSYLYTNCVMTGFTDASSGETKQAQYAFQIDFQKPLISEQEAQQKYNNLMAKIGSQTQLEPNANGDIGWSTVGNSVNNPGSGASPSMVPTTNPDPGMGFAAWGDEESAQALGLGTSGGFVPDTVGSQGTAVASTGTNIGTPGFDPAAASIINIPSAPLNPPT